jgi:hypothetical protein
LQFAKYADSVKRFAASGKFETAEISVLGWKNHFADPGGMFLAGSYAIHGLA